MAGGAHSEGIPAEGFITTAKDDAHLREREGIPREGTGSRGQSLLGGGGDFLRPKSPLGPSPLSFAATGQREGTVAPLQAEGKTEPTIPAGGREVTGKAASEGAELRQRNRLQARPGD